MINHCLDISAIQYFHTNGSFPFSLFLNFLSFGLFLILFLEWFNQKVIVQKKLEIPFHFLVKSSRSLSLYPKFKSFFKLGSGIHLKSSFALEELKKKKTEVVFRFHKPQLNPIQTQKKNQIGFQFELAGVPVLLIILN